MSSSTERDSGDADCARGGETRQLPSNIRKLKRLVAAGRSATDGSADAGRDVFEDLFVLELANNHWGSLARGRRIVGDFADVVHANGVKAAIKLQFRDVETFIHKDFRGSQDIRYVKKVSDTRMAWRELGLLVEAVRDAGLITMSTPFDEISVGKCLEFGVEILKIASSDLRDRSLIARILDAAKPTIMSTGGSSLPEVDELVELFRARRVPLAINHCVSIYPSEDSELELNQIDFLQQRYPDNVIGFSTHEYTDWRTSIAIAYAKGARTFERHIDIDQDGIPVSPYCTLPHQADEWFKSFLTAKRMCGASGREKRVPPGKEVRYLDALVRGVYAKRPLGPGEALSGENTYLAIPLLQGQMSCRELVEGAVLRAPVAADGAIAFDQVELPATQGERQSIRTRGHAA
jgi:N-acetylneuraminate synthase